MLAIGGWLVLRAVIGRRHVHGEGIVTGIAAGLIPCPLTLFLMFFVVSRGVPEAGLLFAFAMIVGVGVVLTVVAVLSVWARQWLLQLFAGRPALASNAGRTLDAVAGILIVVLALASFPV